MKEKVKLSDLHWLDVFKLNPQGYKLSKSALIKGDKIGAYNELNQLCWIHKDKLVTPFNINPNTTLNTTPA